MKIYTVLSYSYSGCDDDICTDAYKSFKSQDAAIQYLHKISKDCYDEYYDCDEYEYKSGVSWAEITNGEYVEYDHYALWYRYYYILTNDLYDEDTIILNE